MTSINERCSAIICLTPCRIASMTLEVKLQTIPRFELEIATFAMGTMNNAAHFVIESYGQGIQIRLGE